MSCSHNGLRHRRGLRGDRQDTSPSPPVVAAAAGISLISIGSQTEKSALDGLFFRPLVHGARPIMPTAISSPPRLSIVIPAPTDAAALEETLVSVLENRPNESEIIVVLGFEYGDPWNVHEEVRFLKAPIGSNRVACINLGLAASRGRILHVLAAGWRATPFWTDAAVEHFASEQVGAVVPLELASDDLDRIVATGIETRRGGRRICLRPRGDASRVKGFHVAEHPLPSGPTLEAGFWSSQILARLTNGFCLSCGDEYADADMAVSLRAAGGRVVLEPASRVVAAAERQRLQRPFAAGLYGERLFWRSLAAEPILQSLVLHVFEVLRHALVRAPLGTLPMLAGRLAAVLQFGWYVPRFRELRQLIKTRPAEDGQLAQADRSLRFEPGHAGGGISRPRRRMPLRRSA